MLTHMHCAIRGEEGGRGALDACLRLVTCIAASRRDEKAGPVQTLPPVLLPFPFPSSHG